MILSVGTKCLPTHLYCSPGRADAVTAVTLPHSLTCSYNPLEPSRSIIQPAFLFALLCQSSPARSTYCCILMCVHMSITGIIKGNLGFDCLCPQGRDRNICCNAYLFLIFLNKGLELFMLHCSNTHIAYKYKKGKKD